MVPIEDLYECSRGVLFIENDLYDPTGVLDLGSTVVFLAFSLSVRWYINYS